MIALRGSVGIRRSTKSSSGTCRPIMTMKLCRLQLPPKALSTRIFAPLEVMTASRREAKIFARWSGRKPPARPLPSSSENRDGEMPRDGRRRQGKERAKREKLVRKAQAAMENAQRAHKGRPNLSTPNRLISRLYPRRGSRPRTPAERAERERERLMAVQRRARGLEGSSEKNHTTTAICH
jgi:hypothetical protein